MHFFCLEADEPLTKTITSSGTEPYPHVTNFTSHEFKAPTLLAFASKLERHADQGHCLIKGNLQRPLINEPRRGATDPQEQTQWICLDFDGLEVKFLDELLLQLGLDADYVIQYSASSGFKPGLRAHVFMFLSSPCHPSLLKLWLKHLNLNTSLLREQLTLNRAGTTLRWPLDITACQNDKLLYIAPPRLVDVAPAHKGLRIQYVKGKRRAVTLTFDGLNAESLRARELGVLNELRSSLGLPARKKERTIEVNNVEVMKSPGTAIVTGERKGRGFVYLNLNGGDSWAYYYPENDPTVLYNFKGEPNYLLKELCPEYRPLLPEVRNDITSGEVQYLAVLNKRDDQYYTGMYHADTKTLDIRTTGSIKKVHDFLKQHGQHVPDFIPEWEIFYDFQSDFSVDFDAKRINLYRMSPYMRMAKPRTSPPSFINSIVSHVLAYDEDIIEHFYNWLAVICQKRIKTMTAWVLSGTQGTGKGLLFHRILTPLLGADYCQMVQLRTFEKEFNSFIEASLIVMINEAEISSVDKNRMSVMASIKEIITDPVVTVRRMRTDHYRATNAVNIIFASNKYDTVEVDSEDRRFNVAPRQEEKFGHQKSDIEDRIAAELQDFANYIMHRPANEDAAGSIIKTSEREKLQDLTVPAPEQAAAAIKKGDIEFFWNNRPEREDPVYLEVFTGLELPLYSHILDWMFENRDKQTNLHRNWIAVLFHYTSGHSFRTSHKFTKFIGHKGLEIKSVGWGDTVVRGIYGIKWHCSDEVYDEWERTKKVVQLPEKEDGRKSKKRA
jgi:hypothetical protein